MGVLEDAVIKAKGAADFAGRKTGEFVELSKLRISIAEVDKKIEAEYLELGKMVYKASREHTDCTDYVQEKATAIDLLLKKRRDLEEKVNALRKVKNVPNVPMKINLMQITAINVAQSYKKQQKFAKKLLPVLII